MYLSTVFAVHPSLAATHLEITKLKVSEEKVQYMIGHLDICQSIESMFIF